MNFIILTYYASSYIKRILLYTSWIEGIKVLKWNSMVLMESITIQWVPRGF